MIAQKNKLVLGTVQLGMKYGVGNAHGQPTLEESFSILDAALAAGIDTFDTAWAYGTAEEVLGAWIIERALTGKVRVISKMKPHALNDYPDGTKMVDIVLVELEKSLKRLRLDNIDGYLFHSPYYIYLNHAVEGLQKAKENGLVNNVGVSVYDEAEALKAIDLPIDYVQVPYNAFDRRLDVTGFFETARKNGVTVFARSPFLQGALLMNPKELPEHLTFMRQHIERFEEIARHHDLTPIEAALRFARTTCRADHIVFGVDTKTQLEKIVGIMEFSSVSDESLVAEIRESFNDLGSKFVNPSLWSKIRQ